MHREKKVYISKVDGNGRIILPDDLVRSIHIHSGLLNVRVEERKLLVKEPEPDYHFNWKPDRK
ncbi:hypothetical protein ADA01nite_13760 [Aneurinibacillus danicus]|uniref:SpoVT-AbrB domain-containing protein n=1 Tax=Aneurinibacillus danicus TaxID=267746 RepID=A0A511V4R7_9BACL|nr:hypothetical protein ADA01nite_13760 [Aneurinibacillus danicus]